MVGYPCWGNPLRCQNCSTDFCFFSERQITSQRFDRGLISSQFITVVNPSLRIDSNHSLDRCSEIFENEVMEPDDDLLLLKRVDPGRT